VKLSADSSRPAHYYKRRDNQVGRAQPLIPPAEPERSAQNTGAQAWFPTNGPSQQASTRSEQVQPTSQTVNDPLRASLIASLSPYVEGMFSQIVPASTYVSHAESVQGFQHTSQPFSAPNAGAPLCTDPNNIGMRTSPPSGTINRTSTVHCVSNDAIVANAIVRSRRAQQRSPKSLTAPLPTRQSIIALASTEMETSPYPVDPRQTNVGNDVAVSLEDQKIAPISTTAPISKKSSTASASGKPDCGPQGVGKDKAEFYPS